MVVVTCINSSCTINRSARNATSSVGGRLQYSLNSYAFEILVETFSILNIVERGRYSRGISDSNPGCQEPYSAESGSMVIAEISSNGNSCRAPPSHVTLWAVKLA